MKFKDIPVGQYFCVEEHKAVWLKTTGVANYVCLRDSFGTKSYVSHKYVMVNSDLDYKICDQDGVLIKQLKTFNKLSLNEWFKRSGDDSKKWMKVSYSNKFNNAILVHNNKIYSDLVSLNFECEICDPPEIK